MKKLFFFLMLISLDFFAQEKNLVSLSLSENPTNKELEFLKEELKDKQVVLLGENTHFDGNVFEYRNKVIKFLVEEMNFTTIAFESGVYDLYKANKEIKEGESIEYALQNSLMGHWSQSKEFSSLYKLVKQRSVKIYGFDSQLQSVYARQFFIDDFKEFLSENKIQTQVNEKFIKELKSVAFNYKFDEKLYKYVDFQDKINELLNEISKSPKTDELVIWQRIIKGISKIAEDVFKYPTEPKTIFFLSETDKIRDNQMAENLLAYINENPNEKIICLGANAHFINNLSNLNQPKLEGIRPMGSYLKENLANKMYTLAFITSCIEKTEPNSIEDFIKKQSDNHLFFSTHQKYLEKPILNCIVSDGVFIKSKLHNFFDGCITFKNCEHYEKGNTFESSKKVTYEIKGKLIDKTTKKPLAFALVSLPNSSVAGFSDEEGNYTLIVPKKIRVSKVNIDYMGYELINTIYKPILKLNLKEKINVLDEVFITAKKSGRSIVEEAIEKKWRNHLRKKVYFKRKTTATYKYKDSVYLEFSFNAPDLNRPYFKDRRKTEGIKLSYTKGFVEKDSVTNIPFPRTAFNYPILDKKNIDKYRFQYEKDTIINNEEAYKITFLTTEITPAYTNNHILTNYSGVMYISKSTDALLKIKHNWETAEYDIEKLVVYWYVPTSMRRNRGVRRLQITFNFKKDDNLKMYIYDTIITKWFGYYVDSKGEEIKLYTQQKSEFTKK